MAWLFPVGIWTLVADFCMPTALIGQVRDEICTFLYLIALSALGAAFVTSRLNRRYINNRLNKRSAAIADRSEIEGPYESSRDSHSIGQLDRYALIQHEHLWAARMSAENEVSAHRRLS
jgi:hypothetical protein